MAYNYQYQQGSTPQSPPGTETRSQYGSSQQTPGQERPPIAPHPSSFGQSQDNVHQTQPANGYGVAPTGQGGGMNGLTSQMEGLGMEPTNTSTTRPGRRKGRHAHHDIGPAAAPPQAYNGIPQTDQQQTGQFIPAGQGTPTFGQQQNLPGQSQMNAGDRLRMGEEAVATQGRVDPEQIPSVARARDTATQYYLANVYPTMEKHNPPPAAIPFLAHDQGNSSPKYARLTINNIPSTAESLASTALPLGLVLQPFAPLQEGEQPIPVLDFGEVGPPRCRRCRTYINPFMTFRSGGNKLVCNMCNFPNDVSPDYYAPTDATGVRVDRAQRLELTMGTVEYLVPKEYWAKEPVGLRWLFLIDVSQESINRNFVDAICQGILEALYGMEDQQSKDDEGEPLSQLSQGSKIGIVTFDKEVQFYSLSPGLQQAQMMVMTDLDDPFVPLSDGLFVDPLESKTVITSLLQSIPNMFSQVKNPEPALLPTLNAALSALSATGGKVICALAALPTWGPGRLVLRDDSKGRDTDAEKKLFTTEHPGFKKTAQSMVTAGIGVDFFLAAAGGGYMDIATIGYVSSRTGGEVFFYPNFLSPRDSMKLSSEIAHAVQRETGFQALMKVRCSNGLQVASYHGAFIQHTFGADLEIGSIDADKAIGVIFSYDGKLESKLDAHFQAALLYTSSSGQRRVRCINICAGVSEGATETMRTVDQDAVVNIVAKEASSRISDRSLKDIRSNITEKTIDILAGYRKNFSGSHPPGQLVLPENLKELSMYSLGLLKSRAFKGGVEPSDRRIHSARFLRSAGVTESALYLYPRIYSLHNLTPEDCFAHPETSQLVIPPTVRASYSRVEEGGVYLIDNGQLMMIWLHSQVSPNFLEDLFGEGITTLQQLNPQLNTLSILSTHLNAQVRNLLQYLSTLRGSKSGTSIQLARQGLDGSEYEYARMLVEDRNNEAQSYVDWLVHLHRTIQMELSGQRKKDGKDGGDETSSESIINTLTGLKAPYWN